MNSESFTLLAMQAAYLLPFTAITSLLFFVITRRLIKYFIINERPIFFIYAFGSIVTTSFFIGLTETGWDYTSTGIGVSIIIISIYCLVFFLPALKKNDIPDKLLQQQKLSARKTRLMEKLDLNNFYPHTLWGLVKAALTICVAITICTLSYHYITLPRNTVECMILVKSDRAAHFCYKHFEKDHENVFDQFNE